eukprot:CAMPEP_0185762222 /NCGR_PEP_ID=MMETSP1174-20130828/21199_1 /TAXON_ID=35687 /ORGANISM="Dictyocha speculum, Strain CCMP1381" /LENGTH=62 /DNA_ID=CAMNT_0028443803 /DNA_START=240 /DNA_END=428 /DNA_ORIENTATION=+
MSIIGNAIKAVFRKLDGYDGKEGCFSRQRQNSDGNYGGPELRASQYEANENFNPPWFDALYH